MRLWVATAIIGIVCVPIGIVMASISYLLGGKVPTDLRVTVMVFLVLGICGAFSTLHYIKLCEGHAKTKRWTKLSLITFVIFGIALLLIPS